MIRKLTEQDFYLTLDTHYLLITKFFRDLSFQRRFNWESKTTVSPHNGYRKGTSSCSHYEYSYNSNDGMDVLLKVSRINPKWTTENSIALKNENLFYDFDCEVNDIEYEEGLVFFEKYFRNRNSVFVSSTKCKVGLYEVSCKLVIAAELWEKICNTKTILLDDKSVLMLGEAK